MSLQRMGVWWNCRQYVLVGSCLELLGGGVSALLGSQQSTKWAKQYQLLSLILLGGLPPIRSGVTMSLKHERYVKHGVGSMQSLRERRK